MVREAWAEEVSRHDDEAMQEFQEPQVSTRVRVRASQEIIDFAVSRDRRLFGFVGKVDVS